MRILAAFALPLLFASACTDGGSDVFIATQSSFAPYASWEKFSLGTAMNGGHPIGPELGYRSEPPMAGAYPVGSLLVKEIQLGTLPQQWELFAMVKRGGGYNAGGARDWEFFTLKLNSDGVPIILTRGSNPADSDSQGHGYATGADGVTCNRCHGVLGTDPSDHILSPALHP